MLDEEGGKNDQPKIKRLLGEQLRADFEDLIDELYDAECDLSNNDLRKYIAVWLQRPEAIQAFLIIVDRCDKSDVRAVDFDSFKAALVQMVAQDIKYQFASVYREPLTWLAFMSAAAKRRTTARRVVSPEERGL